MMPILSVSPGLNRMTFYYFHSRMHGHTFFFHFYLYISFIYPTVNFLTKEAFFSLNHLSFQSTFTEISTVLCAGDLKIEKARKGQSAQDSSRLR